MLVTEEFKIVFVGSLSDAPEYWQSFVASIKAEAGPIRAKILIEILHSEWNARIETIHLPKQKIEVVFPDQETCMQFILEWS
jgi:hypothetical protein